MMRDERTVYIEMIFVILDNPKVEQSLEGKKEEIKAAIQSAPLNKLREVMFWLRSISAVTELVPKFLQFIGV